MASVVNTEEKRRESGTSNTDKPQSKGAEASPPNVLPTFQQLLTEPDDLGKALGRFAGQGSRFFEELRTLHRKSQKVRDLVAAVDSHIEAVELELARSPNQLRYTALLTSGTLPDGTIATDDEGGLLLRPSLSCPLISLAQLCNVWQALHESGKDVASLHRAFSAGFAGFSQGAASAVALASADSNEGLLDAICTAVKLQWLLGWHLEKVEGGMALIKGDLQRESLEVAVKEIPGLHIAGRNLADTFVLSGLVTALSSFEQRLAGGEFQSLGGCKLRHIRVKAPFHSPLLSDVVPEVLADALRLKLSFTPLQVPAFAATECLDDSTLIQRLVELTCLDELDWPGTMEVAGTHDYVVDFGPGGALPLFKVPLIAPLAPAVNGPEANTATSDNTGASVVASILSAVASVLGCKEDDVDLDRPFFELGLTSKDMTRLATSMSSQLAMRVTQLEIFDSPSVNLLAGRLTPRLQAASKSAAVAIPFKSETEITQCISEAVATLLERSASEIDPQTPFFELGVNSKSIPRLAAALSKSLGISVTELELFDSPTTTMLSSRLSQRIGQASDGKDHHKTSGVQRPRIWQNLYPEQGGAADDRIEQRWASFGTEDLKELQQILERSFSERSVRLEIAQASRQSQQDKASFFGLLDKILERIEGPLLLERGLAASLSSSDVQHARVQMQHSAARLWKEDHTVQKHGMRLMRLTLQDRLIRPLAQKCH